MGYSVLCIELGSGVHVILQNYAVHPIPLQDNIKSWFIELDLHPIYPTYIGVTK